jgi:hypothetical protein
MAAVTEGYADTARPLDELLAKAVKDNLGEHTPIVIFICDEEDEKVDKALESKIFCNEKIGVAMKRFVCLKGSIQSIPDERLANKIAKQTPLFHFYDPAGKPMKVLKGKRATSTSAFSAMVSKLWDKSYVMKLKAYVKAMGRVLDAIDKLESAKERLSDKMDRAADKPAKLKQLQKEEKALAAQEQKVQEMEEELHQEACLKPEFKADGAESAQR